MSSHVKLQLLVEAQRAIKRAHDHIDDAEILRMLGQAGTDLARCIAHVIRQQRATSEVPS